MERRTFTEDHDLFRASARRFMQSEIGPHAARWREAGIVDRGAYEAAGRAGLLCLWADPRFGGAGMRDLRFDQIIIEENVRHGETGFYLHLHSNIVAPYIDELGCKALVERIMPGAVAGRTILAIAMTEPSAGSDLRGIRTRARRDGDGWILNGAKTYISNGLLADAVLVVAKVDGGTDGDTGFFLVERGTPGFARGGKLAKIGLHAQDTAELFLENVHVPSENRLATHGGGMATLRRFLAVERLIAAIASVAAAAVSFDLAAAYARERTAFGTKLSGFQDTRFRLAGVRSRIDAIQCFVDRLVLETNAGLLQEGDAAAAKLLASKIEGDAADLGVQIHGGAGYMAESRIARMYADARISRIFGGTDEILKEMIARSAGL